MTIDEMHLAFDLAVQEIDSGARDDFLSTEIDRYLNDAQLEFIKDRFRGLNEAGFNQTPTRIGDLQPIVAIAPLIPGIAAEGVALGSEHEYLVATPNNYIYPVSFEAGITRSADPIITTKAYVPCKLIDDSVQHYYRVSPYHNPHIRIPGLIYKAGFIHVFVDDRTTLVDGRFTYIRLPDTLLLDSVTPANSVSSELPEHVHTDIINIAVRTAIGDLRHDPTPRAILETEAE